MNATEIRRRIRVLDDYELTVFSAYRWPGEDPEAVDRELMRVARNKSKLKQMLAEEIANELDRETDE